MYAWEPMDKGTPTARFASIWLFACASLRITVSSKLSSCFINGSNASLITVHCASVSTTASVSTPLIQIGIYRFSSSGFTLTETSRRDMDDTPPVCDCPNPDPARTGSAFTGFDDSTTPDPERTGSAFTDFTNPDPERTVPALPDRDLVDTPPSCNFANSYPERSGSVWTRWTSPPYSLLAVTQQEPNWHSAQC